MLKHVRGERGPNRGWRESMGRISQLVEFEKI